jgi:hypothetical protein
MAKVIVQAEARYAVFPFVRDADENLSKSVEVFKVKSGTTGRGSKGNNY